MLGYRGIFVLGCLAWGLAIALWLLSHWRQKRRPYKAKNTAYECGFDTFDSPEDNARRPFQVSFYRVGLLFVLFDLELAFLLPWATQVRQIGWLGFCSVVFFLFILTIGFVYEWRKGALTWYN